MSEKVTQDDYHGPALVPGTLRAYRHFNLPSREDECDHLRAAGVYGVKYLSTKDEYYEAHCNTEKRKEELIQYTSTTFDEEGGKGYRISDRLLQQYHELWEQIAEELRASYHPAPHADCRCGFYASYDPTTDFYPGELNGRMVRAVVELSGRVVMGTKGVRAERMKILAIAPDYKHIADPHNEDHWPHGGSQELREASVRSYKERLQKQSYGTAKFLGLRFYGRPENMHRDYPPQDVSGLIGEGA